MLSRETVDLAVASSVPYDREEGLACGLVDCAGVEEHGMRGDGLENRRVPGLGGERLEEGHTI